MTAEGKVEQIQAVSATHAAFIPASMQAVKKWRYQPAMKNGVPVNCAVRQPLVFVPLADGSRIFFCEPY